MCVYCEIPSSHKEVFYNENPEVKKSKDNGDILYLQINIVGDAGCGRTSLIDAYQADEFPSITSVSRYARYKLMKIANMPVEMIFYDTVGLEDFDDVQRRSLMFRFSEISILCYSVDSRQSFENISSQWWPEVKAVKASPTKKPYMLVGLKKDLSSTKLDCNGKSECVTTNEGKALAKSIGAVSFVECSSVTNEGINEVFEMAINKHYEEWRKKFGINNIAQVWKCLCCWNSN